jgi:hypothetical protein
MNNINTRAEFEHNFIDTILNPWRYVIPFDQESSQHDHQRIQEKFMLKFCLYILSYARRGLSTIELGFIIRKIFPQWTLIDPLLDELKQEVLVKSTADDVLSLHDEFWQLIDESGRPWEPVTLRNLVINELCRISRERVMPAVQIEDPVGVLRAMTDHVTYELMRDFTQGYRFYLAYMDRLLRQRDHEDALVLADISWHLLTPIVTHPNKQVQRYHGLLGNTNSVDNRTIERYDRIHYVKLL